MTQSSSFADVQTGTGAAVRIDLNLSDEAAATQHEGSSAPTLTYPWMLWRNDTAKIVYQRNAGNSAWLIVEAYAKTAPPTVNDDSGNGYTVSSHWYDITNNHFYVCADAAAGAAVWEGAGGSGAVSSVFGRTGAVVAASGDYTADQIDDGGGKVIMTASERATLASIMFPAKIIPLIGTGTDADTTNIRDAIAAIEASGQPGELYMSGDFKIGSASDMTGIDPGPLPYLKLTARGSCRWYKGHPADTSDLDVNNDPTDGSGYRLLERTADDGPSIRKTLIIDGIHFEGDLATTGMQLGDSCRLVTLDNYERVELIAVEGSWSSQMGITIGYTNIVRASRLYLHHLARDGFNCSNSTDVACVDSDFEWIVDDAFAANLSAGAVGDLGQQRAVLFVGNRLYNAQGLKLLGVKNVIVADNWFRVPMNYAVYVGADDSFGEGNRPIQDVLIAGNVITDLVTHDLYLNDNAIDTCVLISQFNAVPQNVVVKGNIFAQRTMTDGLNWSDLKLRGIDGEQRQWRRDPSGSVVFADDALVGEVFVGQGKVIRVEAPNGLDRIQFDIDDNHYVGFSVDETQRTQPMWDGSQSWAVPSASTEFPVGAGARATGVDLRGYRQLRLVVSVGLAGGLAGTLLKLRFSLDGGATWADSGAEITLSGTGDETSYGAFVGIPDALRQSIGVQLAMFGSGGNGATSATITSVAVDVKNIDQTSAARLLPVQVLPAEKLAASETALRSFSPQDIADIGFAATPAPTVQTGTACTLALADNHRLVECANAAAITVTVPTNAAVAFPLGARIEIVQAGAGQITVGGAGITLRLPAGKTAKTHLQYSVIALTKRNTDEWIVSGDLA